MRRGGRWRDLGGVVARRRGWCGLLLGLCMSCGGSSAEPLNSTDDGGPVEVPPWACVPGETRACDCPGEELDGIATCAADGAAFGTCDCSPAAMSQGPLPTSTGTDSGSGTATSDSGSTSGPGPMTTDDPSTGPGPGSTSNPDPSTSEGSSSGGGRSTGTTTTG